MATFFIFLKKSKTSKMNPSNPYYPQQPMYDNYNQQQQQQQHPYQPQPPNGMYIQQSNVTNQVSQSGLEYNNAATAPTSQPIFQTYQQPVAGLQGWNDPPEKVFMTKEDESLVEQTPNYSALISNCITTVLDRLKASYVYITFIGIFFNSIAC